MDRHGFVVYLWTLADADRGDIVSPRSGENLGTSAVDATILVACSPAAIDDLFSALETFDATGAMETFVRKVTHAFGFQLCVGFLSDSKNLEHARAAIHVGKPVNDWEGRNLPGNLIQAVRMRPGKPTILNSSESHRLSLFSTLPVPPHYQWAGVAVPIKTEREEFGALVFAGESARFATAADESLLVRLITCLARCMELRTLRNGTRRPRGIPFQSLPNRPVQPTTSTLHATHSIDDLIAAFSSVDTAVVLADRNRRVIYLNSSATLLTGWSERDAFYKTIDDVVPFTMDLREESLYPYPGQPANRRLLICKDGTIRPVVGSILPIQGAGSTQRGFVANLRDNSRARDTERSLLRAKKEMHAVLRQLPVPILILQSDTIAFANETWESMMGHSRQHASEGQYIDQLIHPEDWERAKASASGQQSNKDLRSYGAFRFRRTDGSYAPVDITHTQQVEYEGLLSTMLVCKAKTNQTKIKSFKDVGEGTSSVEDLASGVAHQINNPLTYLMSSLDEIQKIHHQLGHIIRPRFLATEMSKHIEQANLGVRRIRNIVGDLKAMTGTGLEVHKNVDTSQILHTVVTSLRHELQGRATLDLQIQPTPLVQACPEQLSQAFINLLLNAVQSFEDRASQENIVCVSTTVQSPEMLEVVIADNGPGIPSALLAQVSHPFFTTRTNRGQLGIGLSAANHIVSQMGGSLRIDSTESKGTTVTVTLPVAETHAPSPQENPLVDAPGRVQPRNILCIDDEPLIGRALQRIFDMHTVTIVPSGIEALRLCREHHYDLVLCDVMMPEMNGLQFLAILREVHPQIANTLVFMSGGVCGPNVIRQLNTIPNKIISKPFDAKTIRDLVTQ